MPDRIQCRFCRGERQVVGGLCGGCGTPAANARDNSRPRKRRNVPKCPKCGCTVSKEIEDGRFSCRDCMCVHERPDGEAVHHKPDINAMKKERRCTRQR